MVPRFPDGISYNDGCRADFSTQQPYLSCLNWFLDVQPAPKAFLGQKSLPVPLYHLLLSDDPHRHALVVELHVRVQMGDRMMMMRPKELVLAEHNEEYVFISINFFYINQIKSKSIYIFLPLILKDFQNFHTRNI